MPSTRSFEISFAIDIDSDVGRDDDDDERAGDNISARLHGSRKYSFCSPFLFCFVFSFLSFCLFFCLFVFLVFFKLVCFMTIPSSVVFSPSTHVGLFFH